MDESQYQALTAACDRLLRAPGASAERIANQWLHIRSEHPGWLSLHTELWSRDGPRRTPQRAAQLWKALVRGGRCVIPDDAPARADVLFVSHLPSPDSDPGGADFYFGTLPEALAAGGVATVVALEHEFDDGVARLARGGAAARLVLRRRGTFAGELRMLQRTRREAAVLRAAARATADPFEKAVALAAARYEETAFTWRALRLHDAVRRLCERFRPRAVVVLWEGLARERAVFHAARAVDPGVRCIGYQHSVLTARSHGATRVLGNGLDPDVLLACGEITAEVLKRAVPSVPVLVYGTHRRRPLPGERAADAATRCLVIPEGFESETAVLTGFALAAAAAHPGTRFVLRAHPLHRIRLRQIPSNVEISDRADIAEDFLRCGRVLYRGSSAVVHAVLAGVRPIYLDRPGELCFDPLHELKSWRRRVSTPEEFGAALADDQEWPAAYAYCDRYFRPTDIEVVRGLLR